MIEWSSDQSLIQMANDVLSRRVPISAVPQAHLPAEITDDRPTMSTSFYVGGPICAPPIRSASVIEQRGNRGQADRMEQPL